jgi:hypothetical protein
MPRPQRKKLALRKPIHIKLKGPSLRQEEHIRKYRGKALANILPIKAKEAILLQGGVWARPNTTYPYRNKQHKYCQFLPLLPDLSSLFGR